MSSLKLTLRDAPSGRLNLKGLVPDRLLTLPLEQIANTPLCVAGLSGTIADHFELEEGDRDKLVLVGDLARADYVGADMRSGMLVVLGSVGNCAAANMRDGHIVIQGNVGDYCSTGMRGGYVNVEGDAGDYCGSPLPGQRRGMRGGVVRIAGSGGRFLGQRLRSGTIVVVGNIDQGCASSLIAGTILCGGTAEEPLGIGMRRGTILFLTASPPPLHVGFTIPEPIRLSYLYLLLDALRPQLPGWDIERLARQPLWRSLGDRASRGTGEILWPAELSPQSEE